MSVPEATVVARSLRKEFATAPEGTMVAVHDMTMTFRRGELTALVGLACTLVRSPDLLLLDEPSVGVDPLSRRDLWKIVQQLVDDEHLSVIVSTAYMDEAQRCAQVLVLHEGRLLYEGTPEALRRQAQ